MLIVLFGLAGAGKNYVGKLLSQQTDLYFWDADEALTAEMRFCIAQNISFTEDMLQDYFHLVIEQIKTLQQQHAHLVVAQAFYRNKNRQFFLSTFPDSLFIQVTVAPDILLTRLRRRNNAITEAYATKISAEFEAPNHVYYEIVNNVEHGHDPLMKQFIKIPHLAPFIRSS